MIESLETQLKRVQAAIRAIEEGAQEYSIGGRRVTRADLKTLYEREKSLIERIGAQSQGTTAYAAWGRWPR